MKRLLTFAFLSLVLGSVFLFAPASHTAHAGGGGETCSQKSNLAYSDDSGNSNGILDLWPCLTSIPDLNFSSGYASFRNTANSIYRNDTGNWYQLSGCSLSIGLIPVGGNLNTANNTPLAAKKVDCSQWVDNQSIGVALPQSSFSAYTLTLTGNYQTVAQVTLTYTNGNDDVTESSPVEYSPAMTMYWGQTCTQANDLSFAAINTRASIDLWPCMNINGDTTLLTVNASFRNLPDTIGQYSFKRCDVDVTIDSGSPQQLDCTQATLNRSIGAVLYRNQFNFRSAHWLGYHTLTAQVIFTYAYTQNSLTAYTYASFAPETRAGFYV